MTHAEQVAQIAKAIRDYVQHAAPGFYASAIDPYVDGLAQYLASVLFPAGKK